MVLMGTPGRTSLAWLQSSWFWCCGLMAKFGCFIIYLHIELTSWFPWASLSVLEQGYAIVHVYRAWCILQTKNDILCKYQLDFRYIWCNT